MTTSLVLKVYLILYRLEALVLPISSSFHLPSLFTFFLHYFLLSFLFTSHGVVHCTSKNQINQEQLQEKCRREVGVMSSTILCCCPFLGLWMTL